MKKIGIVTYYNVFNYGARLQAYSMQQILSARGYQVVFLNMHYPKRFVKSTLKHLVSTDSFRSLINRPLQSQKMHRFTRKYLSTSTLMVTADTNKMVNFINKLGLAAVICGSDEIWSSNTAEIAPPSIYFLPKEIEPLRFAFAPSANGRHKFSSAELTWLSNNLSGYKKIFVRDQFTKDLVESTGCEVHLTFDPTILVDFPKEDLSSFFPCDKKRKIAFVFSGKADTIVDKVQSHMGQSDYSYYSIYTAKKNTHFLNISPEQFPNIFRHFDLVITNLYHASIFCIKADVPFISVNTFSHYRDRTSKITDLLTRLELADHLADLLYNSEEEFTAFMKKCAGLLEHTQSADYHKKLEAPQKLMKNQIDEIIACMGVEQ